MRRNLTPEELARVLGRRFPPLKGSTWAEFYGKEQADRRRRYVSGPGSPNWKGGRVKVGNYIMLYMPEHPQANKSKYVYEHRIIAEKVLGRPLRSFGRNHPKNEVVHHINFNGKDNRPQNLLVCTLSYHVMLHRKIALYTGEAVFRAMVA